MELYQIIATVNNTSTTFQLAYLPENFEGVKISQSFSFVNPIGYNPKFSVDTMRIILSDKAAIDTVFNTYGLQSDVTLLIKKLNTWGIGYSNLATFAIDFESYEIQPEFSEFALKSVSAMDYYNEIKNTEMSIELNSNSENLPITLNYINYVSLKALEISEDNTRLRLVKNNESKIYNNDTALIGAPTVTEFYANTVAYLFSGDNSNHITVSASGKIMLTLADIYPDTVKLILMRYDRNYDIHEIALILKEQVCLPKIENEINVDLPKTLLPIFAYANEDYFYIKIERNDPFLPFTANVSNLFFDLKVMTNVKIIDIENATIKYISANALLDTIFNGNYYTTDFNYLVDRGVTSANHLAKNDNFIKLKPSEFLSDFSKLLGLVVNAKLDGSVHVDSMETYFNNLLSTANAIEVTNEKDISISYSSDLVFNSVSVGQEQKECEIYPYWLNWMKKLTFSQTGRFGANDLDLSLTKFRADFAGIIDYYMKRSKQNDNNFNDAFIFDHSFGEYWYDGDFVLHDQVTPRRFLDNWSKFLSFVFQNYGLNTLTLSSNGGTPDNLDISGVLEMSNYTLNETPRLLPIQYDFTCLLDSVDFSEKILKINDNGTDVYLFVINAETTDNLSEQKISGLKIQF